MGDISVGGGKTSASWASLTWEEQVLALKDQAREADRALWESGGSIRAKVNLSQENGQEKRRNHDVGAVCFLNMSSFLSGDRLLLAE